MRASTPLPTFKSSGSKSETKEYKEEKEYKESSEPEDESNVNSNDNSTFKPKELLQSISISKGSFKSNSQSHSSKASPKASSLANSLGSSKLSSKSSSTSSSKSTCKSVKSDHSITYISDVPKDKVVIFAISDHGKVTRSLLRVVEAMNIYALTIAKPDFILGLGDNFYPGGCSAARDPLFKTIWRDVFLKYPSLQVPWRMVLGNHDYRGNPMAQVEYHYSNMHNKDKLWYMPSKSYSFDVLLNSHEGSSEETKVTSISFFALDTNGADQEARNGRKVTREELLRSIDQMKDYMHQSTSTWKIVYAHHPMYTQGAFHATTARRLRKTPTEKNKMAFGLEEALIDCKVDCYLAGHEHVFQHHFASGIHNICVGASGADIRPNTGLLFGVDKQDTLDWVGQANDIGFVVLEITSEYCKISFINTECESIKDVLLTKDKVI